MTPEKEAAKAAKLAEKEAAKAAESSAGENKPSAGENKPTVSVGATLNNDWRTIRQDYVFVKDPDTAKALRTANILASQPRVPLTVFPMADNPTEAIYQGGINGFFFSVVLGVSVMVPQGIHDHVTQSRLLNNRITRSIKVLNPFTGENVNVNLESASAETRARLGV